MKNKIALFGKMRSGKNTVADILTDNHGHEQFSFGYGITEIICKYFPDAWEQGKPRKHYQHIGQSMRELDSDVWVNYLLSRLPNDDNTPVVITDCRQLNECERLRENGFTIVVVCADDTTRIERMEESGDTFTVEQLYHETEMQVDLIQPDYYINNTGSIEDLKIQVEKFINSQEDKRHE